MHLGKVFLALIALAAIAFCQPAVLDAPYQVRYVANLTSGIDSVVDIINDGGNGNVPPNGPGFPNVSSGNICVNVYAIDPNEELLSCCSCLVTPNQTVELKVEAGIMNNVLTGFPTSSATIKLLGSTNSLATPSVASCTGSASTAGSATNPTVGGYVAFGTTVHTALAGAFVVTETAFIPATLSATELASLTGRCASIIGNGSGAGICSGCNTGALGAAKH